MNKSEKLAKARMLLSQALMTIPDGHGLSEAKIHVRRAIERVEKQVKKEEKKVAQTNQTNHENWWSNIEAGVANMASSPMSSQTQMRSLEALNKMIQETQSDLDKLEQERKKTPQLEIKDLFLQD
jgi:hypothetical protein